MLSEEENVLSRFAKPAKYTCSYEKHWMWTNQNKIRVALKTQKSYIYIFIAWNLLFLLIVIPCRRPKVCRICIFKSKSLSCLSSRKYSRVKNFKGETWITWWRNTTYGDSVVLWWDLMSTWFWGVTADQYRDVLGDRLSPAMKHSLVRLTEYEHDESYVMAFGFTRTQLNTCWGFGTELLGGSRQNTEWGNIQRFVESMARPVDAVPVTPCDDSC